MSHAFLSKHLLLDRKKKPKTETCSSRGDPGEGADNVAFPQTDAGQECLEMCVSYVF